MQKISPLTIDERKPAVHHVMQDMPHKKAGNPLPMIIFSFLVVAGGIATGWILAGGSQKSNAQNVPNISGVVNTASEAGIQDESSFDAQVEGTLQEGGINGEGTFHIERDGGKTQYVYLTSSVVDLQSYVGKKVKVWGSTLSAKYAPWLIEAGKIKVL